MGASAGPAWLIGLHDGHALELLEGFMVRPYATSAWYPPNDYGGDWRTFPHVALLPVQFVYMPFQLLAHAFHRL